MTVLDAKKAKLFVIGKTRVGKGEIIQTLVNLLTGKVLNIASARMESHTKCAAGYPVTLKGKTIELVDTVGYDDTKNNDICETQFLKMLQSTGSAPYYPPLVVLREMAGTDVAWIEKIRSVFPTIICVVRGSPDLFEQAKELFAGADFAGVKLFHLFEFVNARFDNGITRNLYEEGVKTISEHYATLTPTREKLNFDAKIFQGTIEHVKIRTETRTEERAEESLIARKESVVVNRQEIRTVDDGGHRNKNG